MQIELALFASLAAFYPEGGEGAQRTLSLDEKTTVADLIARLQLPDAPRIVFVNNRTADESAVLEDGDRLAIFPPVGGG
ncbi:MAG: MoaD/ThiS family protein [Coriobacteriia bacterium]|nr:MoaD/ThiS family protein [Coriobacteriia bacterium]